MLCQFDIFFVEMTKGTDFLSQIGFDPGFKLGTTDVGPDRKACKSKTPAEFPGDGPGIVKGKEMSRYLGTVDRRICFSFDSSGRTTSGHSSICRKGKRMPKSRRTNRGLFPSPGRICTRCIVPIRPCPRTEGFSSPNLGPTKCSTVTICPFRLRGIALRGCRFRSAG